MADRNSGSLTGFLVVLAEPGGHVDCPGAVGGIDEVGAQHPEGVGPVLEEVKERTVGTPD